MSSRPVFPRFTWIAVFLAAASAVWAGPRPIELAVDATDAPRGIFHSRLVIPAAPGTLTLAYPKWVQGEHAPTGPVQQVAGFTVSAGGKVLPWRRDPLDMFLVRVEVPAGADAVEVALDYLSPPETFGGGYGETPNATPHLAIVDWHDLLVYPLGPSAEETTVRATLRLPAGWGWKLVYGAIADVVVGSPAWDAGLGPGMKIAAVNGRKWAPEVLTQEVQAARQSKAPIEIAAEHGDVLRTFRVSYHDEGKRYPHLERDTARPDLLSVILAARKR